MNSMRKLLLHDKVEVRQLEEGLRGSWHSGVVVGVSDSCRDVRYDELLCESGSSKLVESIPVTGAIEGLYQRPCVKSNYRGRIRPVPSLSDSHSVNSRLKFGVCVDVLYKEAWWEGVIFDCEEGAKERRVYFPDEGDERVYKVSDIRVTLEWDELSGKWRERGIWMLVNLAREHKQEGHLFQLIRRVWSQMKLHYGFQKMISEWTCGAYCLWKEYFREVICEITTKPRAKALGSSYTHGHTAKRRGRKFKRGSYLNDSVLTRSMQSRKDKEVSLAVRTRRMCMSEPEKSPISAATKGSHLANSQCRQNQFMDADGRISTETPKLGVRGEYDQFTSVCCVHTSDCVREKADFCYGRSDQNLNLPTRSPCCYENTSKMPVKNGFRRMRQFVENRSTPRKLKSSKIASHKLERQVCNGSNMTRQGGSHVSIQALDYESVDRRQRLMQTQNNVGFITRYSALKQRGRGRGRISRRSRIKKISSLKIKKISVRKCEDDNSKLKPNLSEVEASKQKGDDVLGSHCEGAVSVTDSCQELGPDDALSNPDKQRGRRSRCRDSVCFICQYGDELLHCDHCLSSYHLPCVDLKEATVGESFCPCCNCGLCGLKDCASDDQWLSEVCYQCSLQYHVACLDQAGISLSEDVLSDRFCSKSCFEICACLHKLLRISNPTSVEGITWTITRSRRNDCNIYNERVHPLIQVSQVLNVFHECFQPINEPHTGRDLVADIVYNSGSKFRRLDFHGFYVMALVNGDEVVCAATIRIHGQKVAEMPLIATPFKYRRQGMCRLLLHELEKMLLDIGVERLVLPGIATLSETWVSSFGFTEMPASVRRELSGYPFVVFQGTTMFQKILRKSSEVPGDAGSCSPGSIKASECAMDSSNICENLHPETTRRALRPITRTYSRRNKWNRDSENSKSGIDCEGSSQESTKLDTVPLGYSQENCSQIERRRIFNLCYKRRSKLEALNKEKSGMDIPDKNQPTYKFVYKRRRIQASRDSLDCL